MAAKLILKSTIKRPKTINIHIKVDDMIFKKLINEVTTELM